MNDIERQRWIRRRRAIREAVLDRLFGMRYLLLVLGFALCLVFAVLKIVDVIEWSWWVVAIPAGVDLALWIGAIRTIWLLDYMEELYLDDEDGPTSS